MKLQLLIPQYNEDESIIKNMLDSIKVQQGINFDDIEVLIGNDGSDVKLSENFLNSYPYSIQYFEFEHSSPAGARQRLFDKATAEYIMFCDADDMFLTNLAIYTIFAFMENGFDALICDFVEELLTPDTHKYKYFTHKYDKKFVHGKVYRRRHIIDNNIKWREDISFHEDSTYNILALTLSRNTETCKKPIYLWKWRPSSICRSDPQYSLKTYNSLIDSNSYLISDLMERKKFDEAKYQVGIMIYNTYFMLNKPMWLDPLNSQYRYITEKHIKEYYLKNKDLFLMIDTRTRNHIIAGVKKRVLGEGVMLEHFTFDEWIKHIEEIE